MIGITMETAATIPKKLLPSMVCTRVVRWGSEPKPVLKGAQRTEHDGSKKPQGNEANLSPNRRNVLVIEGLIAHRACAGVECIAVGTSFVHARYVTTGL